MTKFLIRRFGAFVVVVFAITVGTFTLVHLLPGNFGVAVLGHHNSAANRAAVANQLGPSKSLLAQYWTYLGNLVRGHLGVSYVAHQSVAAAIGNAFPVDLELIVISQLVALAIALSAALHGASRPAGRLDRFAGTGSLTALALAPMPVIVVLVLIFSVHLRWFPSPGTYAGLTHSLGTNLHTMVLPALALAVGSTAIYFRLLRAELAATLQLDYIDAARSRGVSDRTLLLRHALRPSSLSMLALADINLGALVAGIVAVEYMVRLPGLGYLLIQSIHDGNYLVVQGVVLVVAVACVAYKMVIDVITAFVNPWTIHE